MLESENGRQLNDRQGFVDRKCDRACRLPVVSPRITRDPFPPWPADRPGRDPTLAKDLEFQSYARIIQSEFARLGFSPAADLVKSELVAVTEVSRSWRPAGQPTGSSMSIGLGGGSGGGWGGGTSVGLGGAISFPIGKSKQRMDVLTRLSVQLKRRSDSTVIWEGRAESVARDGTPNANPEASVSRLAAAMFQGFPGKSGEIITVK